MQSEEMKLIPLGDRVLVEPIVVEKETKGGLIIPENTTEKPMQGMVIAVGQGKIDEDGNKIPMTISIGEKILYGKYSGNEITIEDKKYLIMHQDEIFGVFREHVGVSN